MKIENVIDFMKTLNSEQKAFFLQYQFHLKRDHQSSESQHENWDESRRELSEIETRRRGEQGIFG